MNPNEFKTIINDMNAIWTPKLESKGELDIWAAKLKDLDYVTTRKAVHHLMDTDTFRPTPARIKEAIADLTGTKRMSASEAWGIARGCCSRYVTREQLDALPDEIRQALVDAGRASYLGTLPEEQARKAFMGAYNALGDMEHREQVRLSGGMKQIGG